MKRSLSILTLVVVCLNIQAFTQPRWFVNPGVKLGYAFGEGGGTIEGIEVSLTKYPESGHTFIVGTCLSVETNGSVVFVHIAYEATNGIGASIGPTAMISKEDQSLGFTATLFAGFILIPYGRLTYMPNRTTLNEVGSFLKIPIQLSGHNFNLGG